MRDFYNKTILFLTLLLFALLSLQSYNADISTADKDTNTRNTLISKRWQLMRFEETLHNEKKEYGSPNGLTAYPNFISDGTYIDKAYLKLDSSGKFTSRENRWAIGSWTYKSKTLTINISEYSADYSQDRTIGGIMKIKEITDTSLILFKKVSRNGDWTRTYYLRTY